MAPGTRIVLIAEDEAIIRLLAAEALEEAGFAVIQACTIDEALELLSNRAEAVSLLFTDINMPGKMDGLALAHHARGAWPHIALIITSGALTPPSHALPPRAVFVPKPYDVEQVAGHARALTN